MGRKAELEAGKQAFIVRFLPQRSHSHPVTSLHTLQRTPRVLPAKRNAAHFPLNAASRASTSGSSLMRITVRLGCASVGTVCAVTLAGYSRLHQLRTWLHQR